MEGIANMRVYFNGEIIPNTHEGVTFVCECPFSFVIPWTMSFVELQNGLCENIQSHISKRVSNILYRNPVQVFGGMIQFQLMSITDDACMQRMFYIYQQTRFHRPMIELYVEFEQHAGMDTVGDDVNVDEFGDIDWEEDNNDSEERFEANYEVDDENDDGDLAAIRRYRMRRIRFGSFVVGGGNVAAEDDKFKVGMEFGSRESVISAIKSYTISRGVDYIVYEFEPQTFYTKCKGNIVVNRFNKRNEMFEVRKMQDGSVYTVNLAQQDCDCGHFQVERLPCRHVLACCANQHLDWQLNVHDV
ncbi:hypothetical protein Ahy_B04g072998 [Arachis hypogaea]|uniref:SWIM-type domain-containing protein n=1 Tax=Arachis hypogaea TaxID=3818 RepID=A0A444ZP94_ARAHY|nr:hypothetical protein Ahy_B04g072998 [Arachis hypogaea]